MDSAEMEAKRTYRPQAGGQGIFTVIFANLEDKERIFEEGPHFMNNTGLFMRYWEDRYNPDEEKIMAAPIWVRLFGLLIEFWDPEILEGIGNSIGTFVKVAESMKRGKYTSYARISVYMNIADPLPEVIEVEYRDEVWQQPIYYEHIPFRCRRCHEYGHLARECPQNRAMESERINREELRKGEGSGSEENEFREVQRRRKPNLGATKSQLKETKSPIESQNKFKILQEEEDENEGEKQEEDVNETTPMEIIKEGKRKSMSPSKETEGEAEGRQENMVEQTMTGPDYIKEMGTEEEKIMKKLLSEWKK